jgi:hypothetical protein
MLYAIKCGSARAILVSTETTIRRTLGRLRTGAGGNQAVQAPLRSVRAGSVS